MRKRFATMTAAALLCAATLSGAPKAESPVVGGWAIYTDSNCDDVEIRAFFLTLSADNSAHWLTGPAVIPEGDWNLVGSEITITIPDLNSQEFVFTGSLANGLVLSGTYTKDGIDPGCWTAHRRLE